MAKVDRTNPAAALEAAIVAAIPGLPSFAAVAIAREALERGRQWLSVSAKLVKEVDRLPELLRSIADDDSYEYVMAMVARHGGERRHIPADPISPDHPFIEEFGAEAAGWWAKTWGGQTLGIPRADELLRLTQNRAMIEEYEIGVKPSEIARRHNVSYPWVLEILGRHWAAARARGELPK